MGDLVGKGWYDAKDSGGGSRKGALNSREVSFQIESGDAARGACAVGAPGLRRGTRIAGGCVREYTVEHVWDALGARKGMFSVLCVLQRNTMF